LAKSLTKEQERNILELARKRFRAAMSADEEQRKEALTDLKFIEGDQWPEDLKAVREGDRRPCLVLDRLNEKVAQVIGDIRQSQIGIIVSPVDDKGDPETAEAIQDIIKHIENNSRAKIAYNTAFESAARCGRGFFRVVTEYADDESFDQDIKIKRISNVFSVVTDPSSEEADQSDAKYKFLTQLIPKEEYEQKYPGKQPVSMEDAEGDETYDYWFEDEKVRIAEYWLKVPDSTKVKTLYLIETEEGRKKTVEKVPKNAKILKTRKVTGEKVIHYKIDGKNILEGPKDWAGKYIPIIPVLGEEINLGDKKVLRGLIRLARDPQQMMNYWESMLTEQIALQPKVPWLATEAMIGDYEDDWNQAHDRNFSVLKFKADPEAPTLMPRREAPPVVAAGIENRIQVNVEHIKAATRTYDAALGARSNEKSGVAIRERKMESDVGTLVFGDNLKLSIEHLGRVLVDLIPKIYDTERIERIRGTDGKIKTIRIGNKGGGKKKIKTEDGKEETVYDLSVGKYDVTIEAGPTYTTQRQEANQAMMELVQYVPDIFRVFGDKWIKMQDWHEADEIAKRCEYILLPEIREQLAAEKEEGVTPEVAEALKTAVSADRQAMPVPEEETETTDPLLSVKTAQEEEKLKQEQLKTEKTQQELEIKRLEKSKLMAELGIDPDRTEAELAKAAAEGG